MSERLPVQVMKISDTLYAADMSDGFLEVEMIGQKESEGRILNAYKMTSPNHGIDGYFESSPDHDPVPLIETLVGIYLQQKDDESDREA